MQELDTQRVELAAAGKDKETAVAQLAQFKRTMMSAEEAAQLKAAVSKTESERNLLREERDRLRLQLNALTEQLKEKCKTKLAAQFKIDKDAEMKPLADKIVTLEKSLRDAQALSCQLVQEKAGFQNSEKELRVRLKDLEEQKQALEKANSEIAAKSEAGRQEYAKLSEQFAKSAGPDGRGARLAEEGKLEIYRQVHRPCPTSTRRRYRC